MGARKKKFALFADATAKAQTPPPLAVSRHVQIIYMFLKQEDPEIDDFERKKNLVLKFQYFKNFKYFLAAGGMVFFTYSLSRSDVVFTFFFPPIQLKIKIFSFE